VKVQIPDELKKDAPQTQWGKLFVATPVVMTVVATLLAGLASSEMTRAQYDRALAAQQQSKAGDQWSFFQAKRLRSALQHNTLDLLQATTEVRAFNVATVEKIGSPADSAVIAALQKGEPPAPPPAFALEPSVKAALQAVETSKSETEIAELLRKVDDRTLADTMQTARDNVLAFDDATKPVNQTIERLEKSLADGDKTLLRDFTAARLQYAAARYDAEARLNQAIANLLELQVRKSNISAERHQKRSGKFFFGMLAAQAAVIIATFAMAARQRNLLWTLAAVAGIAAVAFAIYVYLRV
jgi:hypothetical protein